MPPTAAVAGCAESTSDTSGLHPAYIWPRPVRSALDQRVRTVVETVRVVVPEPHMQRGQVRVPEVERRTGLTLWRAVLLRRGRDERAVVVVARGREGAVRRTLQRRGRRSGWENPLERGELPVGPVLLVHQDRRLGDVKAVDLLVQEVVAHPVHHRRDDL